MVLCCTHSHTYICRAPRDKYVEKEVAVPIDRVVEIPVEKYIDRYALFMHHVANVFERCTGK
jgi:hypothetical protein